MGCDLQEISQYTIHLLFGEVFQHMQRRHRIELSELWERLGEEICLHEVDIGKMPFVGKLLGDSENICIDIHPNSLHDKWPPLSEQKWEESLVASGIKKTFTHA